MGKTVARKDPMDLQTKRTETPETKKGGINNTARS